MCIFCVLRLYDILTRGTCREALVDRVDVLNRDCESGRDPAAEARGVRARGGQEGLECGAQRALKEETLQLRFFFNHYLQLFNHIC